MVVASEFRGRGVPDRRQSCWVMILVGVGVALGIVPGFAPGCGSGRVEAQAATAVPQLDMGRFVGVWYEVARIPAKKDKCVSDALAIYTAGDKAQRWALVNSCKMKGGDIQTKNGIVKRQDKNSGDGRLKVAYTWIFYHKRWVVAVGPEYEWAVVGSPDHKRLAVLSRTSTVGAEAMAGIRAKAAGEGFDVGKMVEVRVTR